MVLCVFIFVRKQSGAVCALLCSALILMSTFYDPYAVEARGYALMSACVAIALVCYQRADALRWVLLMGLSLAAAGAFQFYAVFALFPFAIAKGAFFWQTRRLRLGVWAALACGMLPVIAFWPLLSLLKKTREQRDRHYPRRSREMEAPGVNGRLSRQAHQLSALGQPHLPEQRASPEGSRASVLG